MPPAPPHTSKGIARRRACRIMAILALAWSVQSTTASGPSASTWTTLSGVTKSSIPLTAHAGLMPATARPVAATLAWPSVSVKARIWRLMLDSAIWSRSTSVKAPTPLQANASAVHDPTPPRPHHGNARGTQAVGRAGAVKPGQAAETALGIHIASRGISRCGHDGRHFLIDPQRTAFCRRPPGPYVPFQQSPRCCNNVRPRRSTRVNSVLPIASPFFRWFFALSCKFDGGACRTDAKPLVAALLAAFRNAVLSSPRERDSPIPASC